ncbi:TRAP transporter small permease [Zoogloea sp.]|uniref:TRAP transporter small permease n=1 Tax=Zoogloea sp. TaxID=49181 RepID=UPI001AD59CD4|nr:TRAP transporter small permease [Zoogloea sp.]MBN8284422.1 TRAP transporter small permease [Zoogloea sp.]
MQDPMGMPHELVEHDRVEHYLIIAGKAMAISGGVLFIALIVMSLVSIIGRKLGFGSVNGDIELMQAGTAVAATAFLPYCTLLGEHIKVDFFTEKMRDSLKRPIDGVAEVLFAVVSCLLAWRTILSAIATHESQEVTTLVSLPLWIPTALLVPGLMLMAVCAAYRAYAHFHPTKKIPGARS